MLHCTNADKWQRIGFWVCLAVLCIGCSKPSGGRVHLHIPTPDLIPEGIVYDASSRSFFVSSVHKKKIIRIAEDGTYKDFISTNAHGFEGGLGMAVDNQRRILIACAGSQTGDLYRTAVYKFDLESAQLLRRHMVVDTAATLFNDVCIDPGSGSAFITNTSTHAIYTWPVKDSIPRIWFQHDSLRYPNGIAISHDGQSLFATSWQKGIVRIDVASKRSEVLKNSRNRGRALGIDGLYYYDHSLIAIVNGFGERERHHIVRYHLNDRGHIARRTTIDSNHVHFDIPTTGTLHNGYFYCLANSQLERLDQQNNQIIQADDPAKGVFILKYALAN